jgi:hypothetical protein
MDTMVDSQRPRAFDPSQATPGAIPPRPSWDPATERRVGDGEALSNLVGWLSLGLGITQATVPERIGAALGMEDWSELIRAYGIRNAATGIGILAQRHPTPWLWARVAGDALDLVTLATRTGPDNPRRGTVTALMAGVAALAVLDVVGAIQLGRSGRY